MNYKKRLTEILVKIIKVPEEEIDYDCDIYDSNLISSLGLLELVAQIEKEFDMTILPEELTDENFSTVHQILLFIESR